ncbi:MAG: hypothetical protein ACREDO_09320 [Methyloceanibacter sp.]
MGTDGAARTARWNGRLQTRSRPRPNGSSPAMGSIRRRSYGRGCEAIAANIAAQVYGTARRNYHLSSLPTGGGKTTMLVAAVRVFTSDPAHANVGVAIFVNQRDLIPKLIAQMGLRPDQFAVRAGNSNLALNALGVGPDRRTAKQKRKTLKDGAPNPDYLPHPATTAQVLFTTQAKLLTMSEHHVGASPMTRFFGTGGMNARCASGTRRCCPASPSRSWVRVIVPSLTF